MIRLKQLLTEAGNMLVYRVNPDACEAFLRKYPKVRTVMTSIARKNKDLMRGYKQFLAFKDKNEKELGGRPETTKSTTFGEKTFWKYDWMGASGWAEIYQYIDGTKLESVTEESDRDTAMVSGVADIVSKVKDKENRKEIAQQMMSKFDLEDVGYDKDSFLKLSKVSELTEAGYPEDLSFEAFAQKRLEGATKIAKDAKEKGGAALLTYHHFVVKLPHYKTASEGKFNVDTAKAEMKRHLDVLCEISSDMEQIKFQRVVGLIEVLGELIIKYR